MNTMFLIRRIYTVTNRPYDSVVRGDYNSYKRILNFSYGLNGKLPFAVDKVVNV